MSTEQTPESLCDSLNATDSTETILTEPFGEIEVPVPSNWELGHPKYPNENTIKTLYGTGGTRIDLLKVTFASNDTPPGLLAKLFIADPAYSPASFETSIIITDPEKVNPSLTDLILQAEN